MKLSWDVWDQVQRKLLPVCPRCPSLPSCKHRQPDHPILGPTHSLHCQEGVGAVPSRSWEVTVGHVSILMGASFMLSPMPGERLCIPTWLLQQVWLRRLLSTSLPLGEDPIWTLVLEFGLSSRWITFLGILHWLHSQHPWDTFPQPALSLPRSHLPSTCQAALPSAVTAHGTPTSSTELRHRAWDQHPAQCLLHSNRTDQYLIKAPLHPSAPLHTPTSNSLSSFYLGFKNNSKARRLTWYHSALRRVSHGSLARTCRELKPFGFL